MLTAFALFVFFVFEQFIEIAVGKERTMYQVHFFPLKIGFTCYLFGHSLFVYA